MLPNDGRKLSQGEARDESGKLMARLPSKESFVLRAWDPGARG